MSTDHSTDAKKASALVVAAIGVVYGDIGTSPLYAFRESLGGAHGIGTAPETVLGVLSMIFWAVTIVISLKYVLLVLMADNEGEGGDLALLALVLRQLPSRGRLRRAAIVLGLVSAAMFYGDSVITPAISVLSAVEGLAVVSEAFTHAVLPLTLLILLGLFLAQRHGTGKVGRVFGPVMLVWFAVLALLGIGGIVRNPGVLEALDPLLAARYAVEHPALTLGVMAAVFLSLTGGEALYADMGHFGRRPIRVAWFWIVMPALMLNYFGQGALVLLDPKAAENPFFLLAPDALQLPLVVIATCATVIASQAVISGAFSMTSQAVKLGFLPRVADRLHVRDPVGPDLRAVRELGAADPGRRAGRRLPLVDQPRGGLWHRRRDLDGDHHARRAAGRAAALGLAAVARALVFLPLMAIDWVFLVSNAAKIPLRGLVPARVRRLPLPRVHDLEARPLDREPRTREDRHRARAVPEEPVALPADARRGHRRLHVAGGRPGAARAAAQPEAQPRAARARRVPDRHRAQRAARRSGRHGAGHRPRRGLLAGGGSARLPGHVRRGRDLRGAGAAPRPGTVVNECSFFLSRQNVLARTGQGMWRWRQRLFGWMLRNAQPASDFFRIPPNRVIEIGTQVVI